jgi:hypothetical protein
MFCLDPEEGTDKRNNSGAAVCKNRLEFFALLTALLEM